MSHDVGVPRARGSAGFAAQSSSMTIFPAFALLSMYSCASCSAASPAEASPAPLLPLPREGRARVQDLCPPPRRVLEEIVGRARMKLTELLRVFLQRGRKLMSC